MRIFLLLFLSIPLYSQSVKTDYDTQIDFKKFRTYAWLAPGDSVLNRERLDKLYGGTITYAANQELKIRGLKLDSLQPDAIFVFYTSVEEIIKYSQSPTLSVGVGVAGPGYYVGGSAPVAGGKITATSMEDGTLKYSMYDTETKNLVWSASVEKTFSMADDIQKILTDYTERIFKKLPIKKKK
ncbi:MAG: DUF4136 domain-containing protein [Cyclobacteriaceae bacterium]|nr:DUF4136 domain-containing protein [Cyclobacteriaceae bacterium]